MVFQSRALRKGASAASAATGTGASRVFGMVDAAAARAGVEAMKHAKTIATVTGLTVIAVVAIAFGMKELAYIAVGALAGYLGKVNGAA